MAPVLPFSSSHFLFLFFFSFSLFDFSHFAHSPPAASHHGRRPAKETEAYAACKHNSHESCVVFSRLPLFPLNLINTALGLSDHCACSPQVSNDHYEIYLCNKAFSGFIIFNSDYFCIFENVILLVLSLCKNLIMLQSDPFNKP